MQPLVACLLFRLPPSDLVHQQAQNGSRQRGMNLPSACSRVYENWRYSNSREQELKAQYLKKLCLTATLWFFILFICIPTFAVGGCAVRLSSIILDWDQGSKPQCCVVSMSFLFLTLNFSSYLGHALILIKVSQFPIICKTTKNSLQMQTFSLFFALSDFYS